MKLSFWPSSFWIFLSLTWFRIPTGKRSMFIPASRPIRSTRGRKVANTERIVDKSQRQSCSYRPGFLVCRWQQQQQQKWHNLTTFHQAMLNNRNPFRAFFEALGKPIPGSDFLTCPSEDWTWGARWLVICHLKIF